jgi:hypothetical protein
MSEQIAPKPSREGIATIIMVGVVSVICILSCSAVLIALIMNAPWR